MSFKRKSIIKIKLTDRVIPLNLSRERHEVHESLAFYGIEFPNFLQPTEERRSKVIENSMHVYIIIIIIKKKERKYKRAASDQS